MRWIPVILFCLQQVWSRAFKRSTHGLTPAPAVAEENIAVQHLTCLASEILRRVRHHGIMTSWHQEVEARHHQQEEGGGGAPQHVFMNDMRRSDLRHPPPTAFTTLR